MTKRTLFKNFFIQKSQRIITITVIMLLIAISFFIIRHEKISDTLTFPCINSYQQIIPLLKQCKANTLILFDIDDTLITAYDVMARDLEWPLSFWIGAALRYPSLLTTDGFNHFCGIMFTQSKRFVIEPEIPQIINDLKTQGCMVIGLTSMESGTLGIIKNMPEWRFSMLKDFDLELSQTFPNTIFTTLPKHQNNYPVLYKGILCCNQQSKGDVLGAFLNYFKLKPQKILFFDDSPNNLNSVKKECAQRKITSHCFKYIRKKNLPNTWNTQRSWLQLKSVMKNNHWLSDIEADVLYDKNPHKSPILQPSK